MIPNLGTDVGTCVQHTRLWKQRLEATPRSLTHGQASLSRNVINEAVGQWRERLGHTCNCTGKRTSLWTFTKLKPVLFRATNGLPRKTRYVSCHFCRSYLKANKFSKSKGTRKVEYAYHFRKYTDTVYQKFSKLVCACRNYSLPKLARFFETQCILLVR